MKIIAVYDNGGKTIDRYTIYVNIKHDLGQQYECLAVGTDPQGFSQWCSGVLGPHNGKKLTFEQLPEHIQKHVQARIVA